MNKKLTLRHPSFTISVPLLLVMLSLAVLVPLVGFTFFTLDRFATSLRQVELDSIESRVISTSAAIDREISGLITTGHALAASPSLATNNLLAFHAEATKAIQSTNLNVLLLDSSAQQIVNTRVAFGTPLPMSSTPELALRVIASGKAEVSDIVIGRLAKRLIFNVAVPAVVDGKTRYVVLVTDNPALIKGVLEQQLLPEGWNVAVRDRTGKTFAVHTLDLTKRETDLADATNSFTPAMTEQVINGEPSIVALKRSDLTGWSTTIWVPEKIVEKPIKELRSTLTRAGLLAVALSILVAYFFSRPFAKLIAQTQESLGYVGSDSALPPISSILREGRSIQVSLMKTHAELLDSQKGNREGRALLDTLMRTVTEGIIVTEFPSHKIIAESAKAQEWLGKSSSDSGEELSVGKSSSKIYLTDGVTPMTWENSAERRAAMEDKSILAEQYIIEKLDGTRLQIEASVNPFHNQAGRVIGTVACWHDMTAQVATLNQIQLNEKHLQLVLRELTHRAKNLLTIILAIATQTARKRSSLEDFLQVFAKRIQGLGASHDLLVKSDWGAVPLQDLLIAQLTPFGGVDNVRIRTTGPDIMLKPDVLQALGLAFHELATNATKYGALSRIEGTVDVKWEKIRTEQESRFKISWIERNGPRVAKPNHKGFGQVIVVSSLAATLNGVVNLEFETRGLVWSVDAPLAAVAATEH